MYVKNEDLLWVRLILIELLKENKLTLEEYLCAMNSILTPYDVSS